jgi:hypothetical protein
LDIAGKYKFLIGIAARELGECDGRDRLRICPLDKLLPIAGTAYEPIGDDGARCDHGNDPDQHQLPGRKGLEGR